MCVCLWRSWSPLLWPRPLRSSGLSNRLLRRLPQPRVRPLLRQESMSLLCLSLLRERRLRKSRSDPAQLRPRDRERERRALWRASPACPRLRCSLISPHPRRPRTPAPLFPSRAPAAGRPSNLIDGFLNSAMRLVFLSLPSARGHGIEFVALIYFCFLEE